MSPSEQRPLDFGPRAHCELLHGGHDYGVFVSSATGDPDRPWRNRNHTRDEASFILEAAAGCDTAPLYLSQSGYRHGTNHKTVANVESLPAYFVDLDYYKVPHLAQLSPGELLAKVQHGNPWLPTPTLLIDSGRGAYLVWVLSHPAYRSHLAKWQMIEEALVAHLKPYGADPVARDAARVLRVVGSYHALAGRRVGVQQLADSIDLAKFERLVIDHAIPPAPERTPPRRQPAPEHTPSRSRANNVRRLMLPFTLAHSRMADYRTLCGLRGPLTDGRSQMLGAFAMSAAWYCHTPDDIVNECAAFAAECFAGNDYPRSRVASKISTILRKFEQAKDKERVEWNGAEYDPRYTPTNHRLIADLEITPDEQRQLSTLIGAEEKRSREMARRRAKGVQERTKYLTDCNTQTEAQAERVTQLRRQGKTQRQIAEQLGLTRRHVIRLEQL